MEFEALSCRFGMYWNVLGITAAGLQSFLRDVSHLCLVLLQLRKPIRVGTLQYFPPTLYAAPTIQIHKCMETVELHSAKSALDL